jgi:hypothetical protein
MRSQAPSSRHRDSLHEEPRGVIGIAQDYIRLADGVSMGVGNYLGIRSEERVRVAEVRPALSLARPPVAMERVTARTALY